MPFNGSGVFSRIYNWVADAANGVPITPERFDGDENDIAAGLTNCVTRNGQSPFTANLPAGGFKLTGLAPGTTAGDSVSYDQISGPTASSNIGYQPAGTGAVPRTVQDKLREWVDAADYGVIYDGNPLATTIGATGTDNTVNMRKAVKAAAALGKDLRISGIAMVSDELEILNQGAGIFGMGPGTGFGLEPLTGYTMRSGLLVTGGTQRIRTRRLYRASIADPQDAPLSVSINVEAEGVRIWDLCVFLWFNRADASPTNYGAACDVGIFNGCRVNLHMDNVHIVGYWDQKGFYQDVTRATNLPEFNDLDGNPYPRGTVTNGADGLVQKNCFFSGGKVGCSIWGASTPTNAYAGAYYDQILGAAVTDQRGTFGCSDVMIFAPEYFATEHHSLRRRNDPTGNYVTDTAGAAMEVDGLAGNASGTIQGITVVGGRIASWEPYRLRLKNANRVKLLGTHIETRSGSGAMTTAGVPLLFDSTDCYGYVSMEALTQNALVEGMPSALNASGFSIYLNASATYHELWNASSTNLTQTFHSILAAGFRALTGDLDLRAATTADNARLRLGSTTKITIAPTVVTLADGNLQFTGGGPRVISGTGTPLGVVSAAVGSQFMRTDGGSGTTFYVKETGGTGNTGWVAK